MSAEAAARRPPESIALRRETGEFLFFLGEDLRRFGVAGGVAEVREGLPDFVLPDPRRVVADESLLVRDAHPRVLDPFEARETLVDGLGTQRAVHPADFELQLGGAVFFGPLGAYEGLRRTGAHDAPPSTS